MSTLDLNRTLAKVLGFYLGDVGDWLPNGVKMRDGPFYTEFDLMRWSDIIPLAVEHKICMLNDALGGWIAFLFDNDDIEFNHKSPQRAIACCLIMVLESKNG